MNYQPFSALDSGAIFRDIEHREMLLMKADFGNRAMLLSSIWLDNQLHPRGKLIEYDKNECVIVVEGDEDLPLPATRQDPIDPRRRFWNEGDTQLVGRGPAVRIEVFAGLFLYSGFGQGTYYAATSNEQFWCNAREAQEKADAEGVLYVYYDSKNWTNDPTLTHEKQDAQRRLDERKAAAAVASQPGSQA